MTAYEYNQLQNILTDIQNRKPEYLSCKYQEGYNTAILKMKSMIHSFYNSYKTTDIEPVRHGHWIYIGTDKTDNIFTCSECGRRIKNPCYETTAIVKIRFPYCNCGAKMDGKETEDEQ